MEKTLLLNRMVAMLKNASFFLHMTSFSVELMQKILKDDSDLLDHLSDYRVLEDEGELLKMRSNSIIDLSP